MGGDCISRDSLYCFSKNLSVTFQIDHESYLFAKNSSIAKVTNFETKQKMIATNFQNQATKIISFHTFNRLNSINHRTFFKEKIITKI